MSNSPKKRGRQLYQRWQPVLSLLERLSGFMPRAFRGGLLALFRNTPGHIGEAIRFILVRRLADECGHCVRIAEGVILKNIEGLQLGDHVSLHPMCYIDAYGGIRIGNDVSIAHATSILSTEHDYDAPGEMIRDAKVVSRPVEIGDNVWIGCGVRILAGVRVASTAVVGAGAVVTRDVAAGHVVAGVPAKPLTVLRRQAA